MTLNPFSLLTITHTGRTLASMSPAPLPGDGSTGFDQVLERLRGVVEKLEQGNLTLEESLRTFEEGVALARQGHALLDAAEKRVETLVRGPDGSEVAVPFRGGDPG
jgi:exodeoxyribonuclease VII small subunit